MIGRFWTRLLMSLGAVLSNLLVGLLAQFYGYKMVLLGLFVADLVGLGLALHLYSYRPPREEIEHPHYKRKRSDSMISATLRDANF